MCNVGWCKCAPQISMCQVFAVPIASCLCLTQQKKRAANQRDSVRQWGASPQGKALPSPNPRGAPQLPPPLASCASHVFQCRARDKGRVGRNGKEEVDDATDGREGERVWWEESEQVRCCRPPLPVSPRSLSKGRTCFAQTSCCHYGRRRRWRRQRPWWWQPTRRLEFWQ